MLPEPMLFEPSNARIRRQVESRRSWRLPIPTLRQSKRFPSFTLLPTTERRALLVGDFEHEDGAPGLVVFDLDGGVVVGDDAVDDREA